MLVDLLARAAAHVRATVRDAHDTCNGGSDVLGGRQTSCPSVCPEREREWEREGLPASQAAQV